MKRRRKRTGMIRKKTGNLVHGRIGLTLSSSRHAVTMGLENVGDNNGLQALFSLKSFFFLSLYTL